MSTNKSLNMCLSRRLYSRRQHLSRIFIYRSLILKFTYQRIKIPFFFQYSRKVLKLLFLSIYILARNLFIVKDETQGFNMRIGFSVQMNNV